MPDISITVTDKRPVCTAGTTIVCDNSDYIVHWDLDEEWSAYDTKTMRVIYMDSTYADTVFTGDSVALPPVPVPGCVQIGLYAGDIHTSRMALLRALSSVRSASGAPANPTPDVYDQLMERMAQLENPDWNQNDPTAKDYIKNRTHYVSRESKAVVPEQEITTAKQDMDNGAVFNIAMLNDVDFDILKTLFNSEDNTTFDVVFDGTSYQCKWLEKDGSRIPGFGNLAIVDSSLTDTGEPFCTSLGKGSGARDTLAIACKVAGAHTVAVSYQQDVVHTLDPKYIKDMYHADVRELRIGTSISGWWDVTNGGTNPVIPKMSVGNSVYENLAPSKVDRDDYYYVVGDYTFNFHKAERESNRYLSITPSFEGNYDQIVFYDTREVVTPIPDKYISEQIPRKSDIIAPVQSDWTETDNSSMAYIKHKPGIIKYVESVGGVLGSTASVPIDALAPVVLVFSQKIGERMSLRRVFCGGTQSDIISSKTGQPLTADECPYGCMVLVKEYNNRVYCINPL